MTVAPDAILKAALMTLHWATVLCRNWTLHPDVPVKMVNDMMEAIHEVPSILMHWNPENSFDMLMTHLSCFDERSWEARVDSSRFPVRKLTDFFRDRLQDFAGYETSRPEP